MNVTEDCDGTNSKTAGEVCAPHPAASIRASAADQSNELGILDLGVPILASCIGALCSSEHLVDGNYNVTEPLRAMEKLSIRAGVNVSDLSQFCHPDI